MSATDMDEIEELWREHREAPIPKRLRDIDINGVDLVLIDADIAGCVSSFLERGTLDVARTACLGLCGCYCERLLPVLHEEGVAYFWRLGRLAELVLKLSRKWRAACRRLKTKCASNEMHFPYPADMLEPRLADEMFREEANAMQAAGHRISFVDTETYAISLKTAGLSAE